MVKTTNIIIALIVLGGAGYAFTYYQVSGALQEVDMDFYDTRIDSVSIFPPSADLTLILICNNPSDYEIDYVRVWQKGKSPSSEDVIYALTVNSIKDRASNPNTILPNTIKTFTLDDINPPRPPVNLRIALN